MSCHLLRADPDLNPTRNRPDTEPDPDNYRTVHPYFRFSGLHGAQINVMLHLACTRKRCARQPLQVPSGLIA